MYIIDSIPSLIPSNQEGKKLRGALGEVVINLGQVYEFIPIFQGGQS